MQVRLAARIAAIALAGAAYVAVLALADDADTGFRMERRRRADADAGRRGHRGLAQRQRWVAACAALGLAALCAQAAMGMKVSTHLLYSRSMRASTSFWPSSSAARCAPATRR